MEDLTQLLTLTGVASETTQEDNPEALVLAPKSLTQARLKAFFDNVQIQKLTPPEESWILLSSLYPVEGQFQVVALQRNQKLQRILLPVDAGAVETIQKGISKSIADTQIAQLLFKEGAPVLHFEQRRGSSLPPYFHSPDRPFRNESSARRK